MKKNKQINRNSNYILLLICMLFSGFVFGQKSSYTISGKVTDAQDGSPIIGASVIIQNTKNGAQTDFNGDYSIDAQLENTEYSVLVSYLGYVTKKVKFTPSDSNITLDIAISEDLLSLDEVVITGTTIGVNKRKLGNAISTVKAADLVDNGAIAVDQAISGKITGALVQQNSGDPAGGISIRLRGPSTILGSSDPLYIVDGIIINNSSNQLVDLGGNSQNRLADLNPNDVESIEVLKGAAAAAIYGSRASNGVVQIITKKGKSGKPRFSFSTNVRSNSLRKKIAYNTAPVAWVKPFDNTDLSTKPVTRYDYQDDFFDTGFGVENYLSVRGGNEKTSYFISASQLDNEGLIKNTDFKRIGFKVNVDQKAFDWLTLKAGLNYVRSKSNDIPNGGINSAYGAITGFVFSENSVDPSPNESGVYPVTSLLVPRTNPLEAVDRFKFSQRTNRIITNVGFLAEITKNLKANYTLGIDAYSQDASAFIPINNTSPNPSGYARKSDLNRFQYNSDLNFSYDFDINDDISSTTILGGSWQYEESDRIGINATGLPPIVQTATSGSVVEQGESRAQISYWGAFVQQSFNFKNKLYVNGALRVDGASSFGENQRNQLYGKASLSYIMSQESFWSDTFGDKFNTFKLRASWGQAGNLTVIGPYSRFTNYSPNSFNGAVSLIPSTTQGDLNIAPERQDEIEFGFDAGFLNGRIGLEFTYYNQKVSDLVLPRELSPSTGYSVRIENVGNLENKGIELLLKGIPVKNENFSWNVTATYSKNENKITKVAGGGQFALGGSFGTNYVIEGQPLGVFYRQFYARNEDGSIALNDKGFPYRGTTADGKSSKVLGDPNPDWFGSLTNEFSYKNFNLRLQLDAVQGFDIFNWNRRLMDNVIFGGGANVGEELLGNRPKGYGRAQAGIFEEFVEDGSFVKLREVALSYNLANPFKSIDAIKFSLIGRNLISWDNYTGWDPEINTAGQSNGVRGFDFAGVPIPKTYQLGVNVSF